MIERRRTVLDKLVISVKIVWVTLKANTAIFICFVGVIVSKMYLVILTTFL